MLIHRYHIVSLLLSHCLLQRYFNSTDDVVTCFLYQSPYHISPKAQAPTYPRFQMTTAATVLMRRSWPQPDWRIYNKNQLQSDRRIHILPMSNLLKTALFKKKKDITGHNHSNVHSWLKKRQTKDFMPCTAAGDETGQWQCRSKWKSNAKRRERRQQARCCYLRASNDF